MMRETRIALLVGLVFIALFGLVLGRRSLLIAEGREGPAGRMPEETLDPGAELVTAGIVRGGDSAGDGPAARGREGRSAEAVLAERAARRRRAATAGRPALARRAPARGPSAPPSPTAEPPRRVYVVREGDNLIRIARKVYGPDKGDEYKRIFAANREKLPDASTVTPGQERVIPPLAAPAGRRGPAASGSNARLAAGRRPREYATVSLEALGERFAGGRTYVVRRGDSLTAIARRQMGSGSRENVRRLIEANRDRIDDPDRLPVGLRIRIPQ
jgi:nucleoid-associated protein YgaU